MSADENIQVILDKRNQKCEKLNRKFPKDKTASVLKALGYFSLIGFNQPHTAYWIKLSQFPAW